MKLGSSEVHEEQLQELCARWKIRRLALFGSALRGALRPESDLDLLAEFEPDEEWSLLDLAQAELDFSAVLGRRVDLVDRKSLERSANWIRRDAILDTAEVIYGA